MNSFTAKTPTAQNIRAVGKLNLLPAKAIISITSGLDWVIKQHLTGVIIGSLMDEDPTRLHLDDLIQLDMAINKDGRSDIHRQTLYGFELSVLYSFLLEQNKAGQIWKSVPVPARGRRALEAQLRGLLPALRTTCRQVDLLAAGPVCHR